MGINLRDIARKTIMNAPGSAGRLACQIRSLERVGKSLEPETSWGSNIFSWKYSLAKPFCHERCCVEVCHSASATQDTYGGQLFSVVAERLQVIIEKHASQVYGLPVYRNDEDFVIVDDSASCEQTAETLPEFLVQLQGLLAYRLSDRHARTDSKDYSLMLLPADIATDGDQEVIQECISLRNKLLASGSLFLTKLRAVDCTKICNLITEKHGLEDAEQWANQQKMIGSFRLLKGCIQEYSLYRLHAYRLEGVKEACRFLAKFRDDLFLLDMPRQHEGDTRLMGVLGLIVNELITEQLSPLDGKAHDAVKLYDRTVREQYINGIEEPWIQGLD